MTSTEIAQIVTGIATLIVAVVLLFQLRKQNQQLDIQHKDTVGNVINQLNTRIENLDKLTISDPELNDLWIRGSRDWNNLKNDNERFRFRNLMRLYFQMAKDHFNLQKHIVLKNFLLELLNMMNTKKFGLMYFWNYGAKI